MNPELLKMLIRIALQHGIPFLITLLIIHFDFDEEEANDAVRNAGEEDDETKMEIEHWEED